MQSPITGSNNCTLIKAFSVKQINKQYIDEYSVNVDKFFKGLNQIELYECPDTGYRFYHPLNIFGDGDFYDGLNKKFETYYLKERWEHIQAIGLLNDKMRVLEIGSGDGYFLEMLKKENITATGLELNQTAVEKSIRNGFEVYNILIEDYSPKNENTYDAVCFFQVLEHIADIRSFLTSALKCLKPGGFLIIGVPNNNPYIFRHDDWHTLNLPPHHAGLWNKTAFQKLVKFFPLKIAKISIEPLYEFRVWFNVQKKYYEKNNKFLWILLCLVPRPLYKITLGLLKNKIEGRNIFAVYTK